MASMQLPAFELKVCRSKLKDSFEQIGLLNVRNHDTLEAIDAIISRGLQVSQEAGYINGIPGKPKNGHTIDSISFIQYMMILSSYIKTTFNIQDETRHAIIYKYKTAYKNISDVTRLIVNSSACAAVNEAFSTVADFLRY